MYVHISPLIDGCGGGSCHWKIKVLEKKFRFNDMIQRSYEFINQNIERYYVQDNI